MAINAAVSPPASESGAMPVDRAARSGVRTDIQGLRALAVSSVFIYHLWPKQLPGGFIGVDVFFVISGFLITSHLLAHPPSKPRNVLEFWSRRVRRLLPASLFVLLATLVASRLVAPDTQWANTAGHVHAAALYFINWRLADQTVDYLAMNNSPSPVQHFWSLSVEEQFYLGWPILILLLVLLARATRLRPSQTVLLGLVAATIGSFVHSVQQTHADAARAYFVTPTRMWELGVGGVLAALMSWWATERHRRSEAIRLPVPVRTAVVWSGLAAIALTLATYSGSTPFPGYQALLPVLGTAAVIAAVAPVTRTSPGRLMALRPIQWLGDVSYSVYLWHWPLIVLVPYVSGGRLGSLDKWAIVVASLLLAGLTKRFVEDPFRRPAWGRPLLRPFVLAGAMMLIVVNAAELQTVEVHHRQTEAAKTLKRTLHTHLDSPRAPGDCFGAAALSAPRGTCTERVSGPLTPDPIAAAKDISAAYTGDGRLPTCMAYMPAFASRTCTFGDPRATVQIALIGNSHAGELLPAMQQIVATHHWHVTTLMASQCALSDIDEHFQAHSDTRTCRNWVHRTEDQVTSRHFDLVVMVNRVSVSAIGGSTPARTYSLYGHGYERVLQRLHDVHQRVVVVRDTPAPGFQVPDCLATHADNYARCDGTRSKWIQPEPAIAAVRAIHDPQITLIDLVNHICGPRICQAQVGDVPVYFDQSHLTATYSKTLAPYLARLLASAMTA